MNFNHVSRVSSRLDNVDINSFSNAENSFVNFITQIEIKKFRHLEDLTIPFDHPITVISGNNKIGKTSILLLIACSHENFFKYDSTKPTKTLRVHNWGDVMTFGNDEFVTEDFIYKLNWRVGHSNKEGEGKRTRVTKSWTGLAKKSTKKRDNAKIPDKEVRLIDLERVLPARSFSKSLRAKQTTMNRLPREIEECYCYVFDIPEIEIYEIGSHVNKTSYLIQKPNGIKYTTYNSATGEESLINILCDIHGVRKNGLIILDEIEAGFHPSIQRRIADIVKLYCWNDKKQFIITTHSPTLLSSFSQKSRKFIELKNDGTLRVVSGLTKHAAFSKLDSHAYPLIKMYVEDELAKNILSRQLTAMVSDFPNIHKLVNFIVSGPIDKVQLDYSRHKQLFSQMSIKIGYACVYDGDYVNDPTYNQINPDDFIIFLGPNMAPEKYLIGIYLAKHPNEALEAFIKRENHHEAFNKMVSLGLASNENEALEKCYSCFINSSDFPYYNSIFTEFITRTLKHFTEVLD